VRDLKGMSEIFSTLLVILIVISFIVPVIVYFSYAGASAKEAGLSMYEHTRILANLHLELIRIGHDFSTTYLYNYGASPVYVQTIIYNGIMYDVNKVLPPGSLTSLNNLTGTSAELDKNSSIYVIVNGTFIEL
jgi:archaeal flagellin N-terminal-like domain